MHQSLHIHTPRCKHASGTEREYVLRAIEAGMSDIGFSDHAPLPEGFGDTVYSVRMDMPELEAYAADICALRDEFKGQINIRLGLELEYIPRLHKQLMDKYRACGIEYFVFGQHFIREGAYMTLDPTDDAVLLREYVDSALEGVETGDFDVFAHPDLINYVGDAELYKREMRRMCEGLLAADIPLEINLHGLAGNRNYPNPVFWDIAAQVGNRVIISSDAHCVAEIWDSALFDRALSFAAARGISVCPKVI